MKKYLFSLFLLLLSVTTFAARIDTVAVFSTKMQREIPALVVTPDHSSGQRLPVLYLLHGYAGDEHTWNNILDLRPLADAYDMMIVCPDGEKSWYWDSPLNPQSQFETFVGVELPAWVDAHYNTIASREGRAITGYSMGGHGGMWVGLRHKDRFGAIGSTSGGVDIRPFPDSWSMKEQLGEMNQNKVRWDAFTVMTEIESMKNGEQAVVVDCGYEDFFFEVNCQLHEKLLKQGINHDFLLRPGKHDGLYWATSLPYQVLFFHRYFEQHKPSQATVPATGLRVVYMGDSITDGNWGKGDGKPAAERNLIDRNHLYGSGFMYLCATYFQGYYPQRGYLFFNRGVSGNALDDLAARWQQDAISTQPDVLSVMCGANDMLRYVDAVAHAAKPARMPAFDFKAWEASYRGLLDASRKANPALKIVLCTPFATKSGPLKEDPYYDLRQTLLTEYSRIVTRIAADYGATLVPFDQLMARLETQHPQGDETYWVWDGIHPTPAGHRQMADVWIDAVTRAGVLE